jgi:hypothetical protein
MLLVVLYKCLTSSFTFRKEDGFRVVENSVLTKLLGPKGEDITGDFHIA